MIVQRVRNSGARRLRGFERVFLYLCDHLQFLSSCLSIRRKNYFLAQYHSLKLFFEKYPFPDLFFINQKWWWLHSYKLARLLVIEKRNTKIIKANNKVFCARLCCDVVGLVSRKRSVDSVPTWPSTISRVRVRLVPGWSSCWSSSEVRSYYRSSLCRTVEGVLANGCPDECHHVKSKQFLYPALLLIVKQK